MSVVQEDWDFSQRMEVVTGESHNVLEQVGMDIVHQHFADRGPYERLLKEYIKVVITSYQQMTNWISMEELSKNLLVLGFYVLCCNESPNPLLKVTTKAPVDTNKEILRTLRNLAGSIHRSYINKVKPLLYGFAVKILDLFEQGFVQIKVKFGEKNEKTSRLPNTARCFFTNEEIGSSYHAIFLYKEKRIDTNGNFLSGKTIDDNVIYINNAETTQKQSLSPDSYVILFHCLHSTFFALEYLLLKRDPDPNLVHNKQFWIKMFTWYIKNILLLRGITDDDED